MSLSASMEDLILVARIFTAPEGEPTERQRVHLEVVIERAEKAMKAWNESQPEDHRLLLKRIDEWFSNFGFNRHGILCQDDVPDHEHLVVDIKQALKPRQE